MKTALAKQEGEREIKKDQLKTFSYTKFDGQTFSTSYRKTVMKRLFGENGSFCFQF